MSKTEKGIDADLDGVMIPKSIVSDAGEVKTSFKEKKTSDTVSAVTVVVESGADMTKQQPRHSLRCHSHEEGDALYYFYHE